VGAFPKIKCGIGDYTALLAELIENENNDVKIITSTSVEKKENVYNIMQKWNFSELKKIITTLKEINPDIVHIQYPSNQYGKSIMINLLPFFIKLKIKCKIVYTIHEYITFTKKGRIRTALGTWFSDKVVVVEKKYITAMKKDKLISKKRKLNYIPIASNIPKSKNSDKEKANIRKKYNLNEKYILSYFGFIIPSKGFEYILNALKDLIIKNYYIKLLVIGGLDEKNNYHLEIKKLISKLNLQKHIIFTGFVDSKHEVANILNSTDLCILPFTEGVSERNGSFLAAYNQDIKIVTTSKEKINDNNEVYYANTNDQDSINSKIEFALKNKIEIKRGEINSNNMLLKHLQLYNEVLKNEKDIL